MEGENVEIYLAVGDALEGRNWFAVRELEVSPCKGEWLLLKGVPPLKVEEVLICEGSNVRVVVSKEEI